MQKGRLSEAIGNSNTKGLFRLFTGFLRKGWECGWRIETPRTLLLRRSRSLAGKGLKNPPPPFG
jgi:hypothetical protein